MPTSNPRLTITLTPAVAAQMRRISELTGNSQSALIGELLEQSAPMFERLITLLTAATEAKAALSSEVMRDLEVAQSRLEKQLGLALDTFDAGARPILDVAEDVRRRGRRADRRGTATAGRAAAQTPPSNRGVRYDPKQAKKPTGTKA